MIMLRQKNIMQSLYRAITLVSVYSLSGCGFFDGLSSRSAPDSAPSVVMDPKKIKDATPRVEARSRGGNRSKYQVFGKWYKVLDSVDGYRERGDASWYGVKFHGNKTANGETYNMYEMTAAHKHLPLPSYVRVKNLENGKQTIVRVNDRGPFHSGRIIDLSYAAATKLDILKRGTAKVEIEVIDPKQWLAENKQKSKAAKGTSGFGATALSVAHTAQPKYQQAESNVVQDSSDPEMLYLQVAAYQNLETAQSLQNRLLARLGTMGETHADTNVVIHPTASGEVYRVRIGPLMGDDQLKSLKNDSDLSSFGNMYAVRESW